MGSIAAALVPAPELKRKRIVDDYASAKRTFVSSVPSPMASYSYRRRNALRFELVSLAGGINNTNNNNINSNATSAQTTQESAHQHQQQQEELQSQQSQQSQQSSQQSQPPVQLATSVETAAATATAPVIPEVTVVPPPPPMAVDDAAVDSVPSLATPSSTDSILSLDLSASSTTIAAPTSDVSSDDVPTPALVDNSVNERRSTRNVSPRKQSTGQRGRPPSAATRARRQAVSTN